VEIKIGGYYDPTLLPDYMPHGFQLKQDKLVQNNIVDSEDKLVPCWDNLNRLRPRTLVICVVTLNVWNIAFGDRAKGNWRRVLFFSTAVLRR